MGDFISSLNDIIKNFDIMKTMFPEKGPAATMGPGGVVNLASPPVDPNLFPKKKPLSIAPGGYDPLVGMHSDVVPNVPGNVSGMPPVKEDVNIPSLGDRFIKGANRVSEILGSLPVVGGYLSPNQIGKETLARIAESQRINPSVEQGQEFELEKGRQTQNAARLLEEFAQSGEMRKEEIRQGGENVRQAADITSREGIASKELSVRERIANLQARLDAAGIGQRAEAEKSRVATELLKLFSSDDTPEEDLPLIIGTFNKLTGMDIRKVITKPGRIRPYWPDVKEESTWDFGEGGDKQDPLGLR
jgi:hypothetical protein